MKMAEKKVSDSSARSIAEDLGFSGDFGQLLRGMEVEKEHGPEGPEDGKFNITDGDSEDTASIAAAHISEIPDYYDRLDKMEETAKKEAMLFAQTLAKTAVMHLGLGEETLLNRLSSLREKLAEYPGQYDQYQQEYQQEYQPPQPMSYRNTGLLGGGLGAAIGSQMKIDPNNVSQGIKLQAGNMAASEMAEGLATKGSDIRKGLAADAKTVRRVVGRAPPIRQFLGGAVENRVNQSFANNAKSIGRRANIKNMGLGGLALGLGGAGLYNLLY